MSETVIRAEGLGKRYRIGAAQTRPRSFREAIARTATAPFRNLARLSHAERPWGPGSDQELVWALLTRSDPATSIDIIRNAWSTPLDPRIEPERKAVGDYTNSRAIIDACRPWHWRDKFPRVNVPSPEERRIAQEKFGHLFKT
jgi:hypothetical protein